MEKKNLGETKLSWGPVLLWPMKEQCMIRAVLQVRLDQNILRIYPFPFPHQHGHKLLRISADGCRVEEAFTGLMRMALKDELEWVQAQVLHRRSLF